MKSLLHSGKQNMGIISLKLKLFIIFITSLLFSILILGNILRAQWSIIDDHETMHIIGKQKTLNYSIINLPQFLNDTEIGKYGKYPRFRPTYYAIRIIESLTWGNNPVGWWVIRFIIFLILVSTIWALVQKSIGLFAGGVFTFYLFTPSYWSDIFTRLGPSEIYASLGLALYAIGFIIIYKQQAGFEKIKNKTMLSGWLILTLGAIIAIGSKENFVLLIFPSLGLLIFSFKKKNISLYAVFSNLVQIIFTGYIVMSILIYLKSNSHDVYGRSINIINFINLILLRCKPFILPFLLLIFSILILGYIINKTKEKEIIKDYIRLSLLCSFVCFSLIGLYLSQVIFYSGEWPSNNRYDFPGVISLPFLYFTIFIFLLHVIKLIKLSANIIPIMKSTFGIVFLCIIILTGYKPLFDKSIDMTYKSIAFTKSIKSTVIECKNNPTKPIVFESYNVWDYEKIVSVRRFLLAFDVKNEMFLRLNNYPDGYITENKLTQSLSEHLNSISLSGSESEIEKNQYTENYTSWGFEPLSKLDEKNGYLVIRFGGTDTPGHKNIGVY